MTGSRRSLPWPTIVLLALVSSLVLVSTSAVGQSHGAARAPDTPASETGPGGTHLAPPRDLGRARSSAPAADRSFTIAVVPDTQLEVLRAGDTRLIDRMTWLTSERERLDLRFVVHTGDLTYWGWRDPAQLRRAVAGLAPLEAADVPYAITVGNHDTRLTGTRRENQRYGTFAESPRCERELGRRACVRTRLLRDTRELDAALDRDDFGAVQGVLPAGSIANTWSSFDVDGSPWLVLTLEPWPRRRAVEWARSVVADHPDHQVIVSTHAYLDPQGRLDQMPIEGTTSPRELYAQLISVYPNIRVVVSGHTGKAAIRVDRGRHGNRILSLLQAYHSRASNPVRLLRIDPDARLLTTRVVTPVKGTTLPGTMRTVRIPQLR